ncbi:MAG: TetR/AcrR family transcriptional regulator [Propionibacteriales bacterium]|nr:TetR/AcrR family transcriptional regulator [Propionibacteriales bacterium]
MRSRNGSNGPSFIERARREQIIGCAVDSLAEDGFAATSIGAVATRAEVAKSAVLYYFGSKAGLLEAVVESVYADAAATLSITTDTSGDSRERLRTYLAECTAFADENRGRTAALTEIFANLRSDDGNLRYGVVENAPMVEFVADLLRRGQADGTFGAFDPTLMALSIRSAIDTLPALFASQPNLSGAQVSAHLISLFVRATQTSQ